MTAATILITGTSDSTQEIAALINDLGYTAATATEKTSVPAEIDRLGPRLVLCVCSGDDAADSIASLRRLPSQCNVPVLFCLPSAALDQLPADILETGCNYIARPIARRDLQLRLAQTLATTRHRQHSENLLDFAESISSMGHWCSACAETGSHWSPGLYRLLGLDPRKEKAGPETLLAHVHADDRQMVEEHFYEDWHTPRRRPLSYRIVRADGTTRFVREHRLPPGPESTAPDLFAGFLQDITWQRTLQKTLQQSSAEMDQFAHIASHDLQEPLRAINGFMQLLQNRYRQRLDDKGREFIDRSLKAGRRMEQLIKELLLLSRISSRGRPFAEEDLGPLLAEATDRLGSLLRKTGGTVSAGDLPRLPVDGTQIATVFYHLIANGLIYNTSGSPRVEIESWQEESMYHFCVRDNGIGVAPEFQSRIFQVFQRLHSQREYPGVGMGLTHSKKIIERHGGIIWVESAPQEGAAFHFTLPARRS